MAILRKNVQIIIAHKDELEHPDFALESYTDPKHDSAHVKIFILVEMETDMRWKLVVPSSPTPSFPILLLASRPWTSPPSSPSHRLPDDLNKGFPLLFPPEHLRELQLRR